jgi:hypothetical protein
MRAWQITSRSNHDVKHHIQALRLTKWYRRVCFVVMIAMQVGAEPPVGRTWCIRCRSWRACTSPTSTAFQFPIVLSHVVPGTSMSRDDLMQTASHVDDCFRTLPNMCSGGWVADEVGTPHSIHEAHCFVHDCCKALGLTMFPTCNWRELCHAYAEVVRLQYCRRQVAEQLEIEYQHKMRVYPPDITSDQVI